MGPAEPSDQAAPPETKKFSLKPIEINLLNGAVQQHQATMANILSFISIERLAYNVTERTQFNVEGNVLTISELPADQPLPGQEQQPDVGVEVNKQPPTSEALGPKQ